MIVMCPMCPSSKVQNNVMYLVQKAKQVPHSGQWSMGTLHSIVAGVRSGVIFTESVGTPMSAAVSTNKILLLNPAVKSVPELKYFLHISTPCSVYVACVVFEVNIGSAGVHGTAKAETKSSPFQFFGHKSHRSCCRENLRR